MLDEGIDVIPKEMDIAEDIQSHFDYHIPLLDRQVKRLQDNLSAFLRQQAEAKRIQEIKQAEAERTRILEQQKQTIHLTEQEIVQSDWWQHVKDDRELSTSHQLGVIVYLKELNEARFVISKVCEFLINHYDASAERHRSGLYKIISDVGLFLQDLENEGRIRFVKRVGNMERLYEVVDPYLLNT